MRRKICVVTGTRAEYGLMRWLMEAIAANEALELQLVVTGMHLSPEFGLTWHAIEEDGFKIDRKVEMLLSSDTPVGITKSIGLAMIGFSEAFSQLAPDILVVLGDRFEILAAATSAMVARIPIAHIHGGEATEGLIDEAIRHAVTKMSHLHFVATDEYRRRVIQLGENPSRVFEVGGLGLDNLDRLELLSLEDLEKSIGFKFLTRNLLITFHPVTLENNGAALQLNELLVALKNLENTGLIFTLPNSDTDGRVLIEMVQEFVKNHPNAKAYQSLGQLKYLSCMRLVDGVIGNSSSGLIEAPSLKKGTINIGERQEGRIKSKSVIDCEPNRDAITKSLNTLYSKSFQKTLKTIINPYGKPGASDKVVEILRTTNLEGLLRKKFYDMDVTCV